MTAAHVLAVLLTIGCASTGIAVLASDDARPQESERSRTRDAWQRPGEVLDALRADTGRHVADIGSGSGYFTIRLAERVGREGRVYAVDVDRAALDRLRERTAREGLEQVEVVHAESADPRLPARLDAALIVDAYHEFRHHDEILQAVFRALVPGGRLVIIDGEAPGGRARTEYHRMHRIPADLVQEDAVRAGFAFRERRPGFHDAEYGKQMYFLVFEKPQSRISTGVAPGSPLRDHRNR
jgi:predicted methyltransferase